MNIANHSDWGLDVYDITLLHKQLFRFCAYSLDDRLGQQLLLVQTRYALVEVNGSCIKSAQACTRPAAVGHTRKTRHGGICKAVEAAPACAWGSGHGVNTGRKQMAIPYNHPRGSIGARSLGWVATRAQWAGGRRGKRSSCRSACRLHATVARVCAQCGMVGISLADLTSEALTQAAHASLPKLQLVVTLKRFS